MTPTCYADLHLDNKWTFEADSQGAPGKCTLAPGMGYIPMMAHFQPATRPPGQPWNNAYILHRNAYSAATQWAYTTSVRFPTLADVANCEAYEQDRQDNDGKMIFNWGFQFWFGHGFRVWNRSAGNGSWGNPVLDLPPSLAQCLPTRINALMERDSSNVFYRGVSFNGVWHPLNIEFPAVPKPQNQYVNAALQLDSKGEGAPIALEVHECSLVGF